MNRVILVVAVLLAAVIVGGILYAVRPQDPVARHTRDLESPQRYVQAVAAYRLGLLAEKAAPAVPALIRLLEDRTPVGSDSPSTAEDPSGKSKEALRREILEHLRDNPRAEGLAERILRTSPGHEANRAILQIGRPAVPALIGKLKGHSMDEPAMSNRLRLMLYELLVGIKDPRAISVLEEITLGASDGTVRVSTFRYLLSFGLPATDSIVRCLGQEKGLYAVVPDAKVTEALRRAKAKAVPPLAAALKDDSPDVRRQATRLLCDLLRAEHTRPIRELLMIPLAQALESKDTRAGAHNLGQLADVLEGTRDPRAVEPLCKTVIAGSSGRIREVALDILRRIGRKDQTVGIMKRLLEANDPDVQDGTDAALRIYEGRTATQPQPTSQPEEAGPPAYMPD